jgi:hypothetical protein
MTHEQIAAKIGALVKSTKAELGEAKISRDKEWERDVAIRLSVLRTVCGLIGVEQSATE